MLLKQSTLNWSLFRRQVSNLWCGRQPIHSYSAAHRKTATEQGAKSHGTVNKFVRGSSS